MQILLAILIATTASKVQSAGFACSKCPILSNLYSLAQEIPGWKVPEAPNSNSGEKSYNYLQWMNDKIIHFMKQYEVAETEADCKSLLCDQKKQFLMDEYFDRATVSSIFEEYDAVHENYVEQLGRGVYNLSSEYCQVAGQKINEITNMANSLTEKLYSFIWGASRAYSDLRHFANLISSEIRLKFDGTDKTKCRYLNPEFFNCIDRNFSEDHFKSLPNALQNQLDYFLENCNKTKHELESMKRPGIDCD